jgi:hypothetical protein
MNPTQLQQKIAEYFQKLPKEAQESFSSMAWLETLKTISTKYRLNEAQIETLGAETTLVLLGIINTDEYQKNIEKELTLSQDTTQKIFTEINESVLSTIKTQLAQTYEQNAQSLAEEKYGGEKKLDERFSSLPKEVQDAINESDYQETLYLLSQKYKLPIDKMGLLEEITTKVMLGIIHPDKYGEELKTKLGLNDIDNSNLVDDINNKILKTIKGSLKEHWQNSSVSEDKIPLPPYKPVPKETIPEKSGSIFDVKPTATAPITPIKTILPISPVAVEKNIFAVTENKKAETEIYENAGINILDKKNDIGLLNKHEDKITPKENIVLEESGINMLQQKLNDTMSNVNTISSYTIPKINNKTIQAPTPPTEEPTTPHDPYHEAI